MRYSQNLRHLSAWSRGQTCGNSWVAFGQPLLVHTRDIGEPTSGIVILEAKNGRQSLDDLPRRRTASKVVWLQVYQSSWSRISIVIPDSQTGRVAIPKNRWAASSCQFQNPEDSSDILRGQAHTVVSWTV